MGQPWVCDNDDGNGALIAVTNLSTGDVLAYCPDCAPPALHRIADALAPAPNGATVSLLPDAEGEPATAAEGEPAPVNGAAVAAHDDTEGAGPADTPARPFPGHSGDDTVTAGAQRSEPAPAQPAAAAD